MCGKWGGTPDINKLFELIVDEAPRLVDANECSIFWKNGIWREKWRAREKREIPDCYRQPINGVFVVPVGDYLDH